MKLQNLDAEIRATSGDCPPLFRGIVAHVNGYTQPSLQDLHRLIVSHGGGFLQYLDGKTSATHIIASSLTPKKREEFRRYRIVKPTWVTESIKAGRLLPWNDFRVVDEGQSQKVLKFGSGGITSQTNSPKSSYRDQSSTSWYNSQLTATGTMATRQDSRQKPTTPASQQPAKQPPSGDVQLLSSAIEMETKSRPPASHESSQQQVTKTPSRKYPVMCAEDDDELESPRKEDSTRIQVDPVLSNSAHKPLNLSGSQFILPAQPEPKALSETQGDIRSKLKAQGKPREDSRSRSPCPPPRHKQDPSPPRSAGTGLPFKAQLDPETLAALPEDIRNEVLGYYNQSPTSSTSPVPHPTPSTSISHPTPTKSSAQKRPASPPRKKPNRLPKTAGSNRTLMQLGFVSQSATTPQNEDIPSKQPLPAKVEPEQAFQPPSEPRSDTPPSTFAPPKHQASPSLSGGPVFTSQHVSNLDDLRESISAWHSAFMSDGPYKDDVESMCTYLRRVIAEEKDVDKATSVVRWLTWLVNKNSGQNTSPSAEQDVITWMEAIQMMQERVQTALSATGLPPVGFE
ncbi:uncharacterized protein N7459_004131 [Penicillium hispanicum]|uniref:uncharacterized protein n=1 Tax=Penicillium hispanicum TaxID=1080232 RepID=UPI002541B478|nr:uncharacterized protein N7459_004131 [Penicillium hispanicum]KAJ5584331.1 hypothetical protein N7459_004131 [Penicillium hispanicum]